MMMRMMELSLAMSMNSARMLLPAAAAATAARGLELPTTMT